MRHPLALLEAVSAADTRRLRARLTVAVFIAAAHVSLVMLMGKAGRQSLAVVIDLTLFPLAISSDEPVRKPEPTSPEGGSEAPSAFAGAGLEKSRKRKDPTAAPSASASPPENQSAPTEAPPGEAGSEAPSPRAPIDWYAEARTSADAMNERDRVERERHSFADHKFPAPADPKASPFFEPDDLKKDLIEKKDGEVVRWVSDRCYQILVTENPFHRGMTQCFVALGKRRARGDLFKHLQEPQPPPPAGSR